MRRPYLKNIFAKGLTAVRRGLSLATKGILDQKRGGKPVPSYFDFELRYRVEGVKKWEISETSYIIGRKTCKLTQHFDILGEKVFELINECLIKGTRLFVQSTNFNVVGQKNYPLEKSVNVLGTKEEELKGRYLVSGKKGFSHEMVRLIEGKKEYSKESHLMILGSKLGTLKKDMLIRGERDISPILLALDLTGGSCEE